MSWPGCCFSFETSAARSPLIRYELFHVSFFKVFEATYFGMLLNRSAKPSASFCPGQAAANPSYVTRPRRSASVARSSSNLNFPVSSLQNRKLHFSGASTAPSKVMNKVAAKVRVGGIDPLLFPRKHGTATSAFGTGSSRAQADGTGPGLSSTRRARAMCRPQSNRSIRVRSIFPLGRPHRSAVGTVWRTWDHESRSQSHTRRSRDPRRRGGTDAPAPEGRRAPEGACCRHHPDRADVELDVDGPPRQRSPSDRAKLRGLRHRRPGPLRGDVPKARRSGLRTLGLLARWRGRRIRGGARRKPRAQTDVVGPCQVGRGAAVGTYRVAGPVRPRPALEGRSRPDSRSRRWRWQLRRTIRPL